MKLGDRITISKKLHRTRTNVQGVNCIHEYTPSHQMRNWVERNLKTPAEVMVIGQRTLRDGKVFYENEIGSVFYQTGFVKAYLVVKDMNSKPFYIKHVNEP